MNARVVRLRRLLSRSPAYIVRRAAAEARAELDRLILPKRSDAFRMPALLARSGETDAIQLWNRLADQTWPVPATAVDRACLDAISPGASETIIMRAERACRHEVDLLGSGLTTLGDAIAWDVDFKTGDRWAPRYFRDIQTVDPNTSSDVKVPWELSRLQWLLPLGQAYLLTGAERYAEHARAVLEQWIALNPVGRTVNWAIAMEPAMRVFSWTWLFRVFARAPSWTDASFRGHFLCSLYQHGRFIYRYIERADLNGNHFTADCAALVVVGAFFSGSEARRWLESGMRELEREVGVQILEDGTDIEASSAYHRLVCELLLIAAIHAEHRGLPASDFYRERLGAGARFAAAYSRPDGTAPLWGDADDARVFPFGTGPVNDHRHLVKCVAAYLKDAELGSMTDGGREELFWLFGATHAKEASKGSCPSDSIAFPSGGAYILRAERAHVFVDCGAVGFGGRGGHGHNDALSFEAVLGDVAVVEEGGCFVYTASFAERNYFRSTSAHNTPSIDAEEINRFIDPNLLWYLRDDAHPIDARIKYDADCVIFEGAHSGYLRLPRPVVPWRRIALRRDGMLLSISDWFDGDGRHDIRIPLQLARGWEVESPVGSQVDCIHGSGRRMRVEWSGSQEWSMRVARGRIAPSYGVVVEARRLEWSTASEVDRARLTVTLKLMGVNEPQVEAV